MQSNLPRWIKVLWSSLICFLKQRYTYEASALSFTTLLSLVPLISVIGFLINIFPAFSHLALTSRNYFLENFTPTSTIKVESYLDTSVQHATSLAFLSFIFLFFTSVLLILTIEESFNRIWHTKGKYKSYWTRFIYWSVLIFSPLIIGIFLLLITSLTSMSWFITIMNLFGINKILLSCIPLIINTFIFSIIYIVVPRYKVKWRDGIFGGIVAAFLFEISKYLFTIYLKIFTTYEFIYGTLATIPIFLVWIYLIWVITLYGIIVTYESSMTRNNQ